MKAEANGRWIVTTVIAVSALVVSVYTAHATWQNNATTIAALEESKLQFEATGPRYSAEAFAKSTTPKPVPGAPWSLRELLSRSNACNP